MSRSRRTCTTVALLSTLVLAIYAWQLGSAPVYLAHDEVVFALNAQSIAATGRGMEGDRLPLWFHVAGNYFATPVNIYLTALFLKALPISETSIRLPSVLIGLMDVVLMYFVAGQLFDSETLAIVAAVLLALTPAHMIHSRIGVDHLYPVPFVLAWLLLLLGFLQSGGLWKLLAATACLGVGTYTYLAAVMMMPVYWALTYLTLLLKRDLSIRTSLVALTGFAVPLVPLAVWMIAHPQQYQQQMAMYGLGDSSHSGLLRNLARMLDPSGLAAKLTIHHDFFSPVLLFLTGDPNIGTSTQQAGVFLLPLGVFLPLGAYQVVTVRRTPINLLLLVGLVLAPLAADMVGEVRVNRALVMLPFAVLLATIGVDSLLSARQLWWRFAAVGLLACVPLQFAVFYKDYLTDYRVRSSIWFESNIRGALENVIAHEDRLRPGNVYLSNSVPWLESYWRFYLLKNGRTDLARLTTDFDSRTLSLDAVQPGGLLVGNAGDERLTALGATGALRKVGESIEPNGTISFGIWQR